MANEIEIQLERVKTVTLPHKEECFKVVNERYLNSYLASLGVNSNCEKSLKRYVSQNAPLGKCQISAAWSDFSNVAETLRIEQPRISSKVREREEREAVAAARAKELAREEKGGKGLRYASVLPPEIPVPGRAERKQHGDGVASQRSASKVSLVSLKLAEMAYVEEKRRSEPLSMSEKRLTEELEQTYRKARGRGPVGSIADEFADEVQKQELAKLQQRYILPFACRGLDEAEGSRQEPPPGMAWPIWQLAADVPALEVPQKLHRYALEPVKVTVEQISDDTRVFIEEKLPLRLLASRPEPALLAAAQEAVCSPELGRMVGLICHLLYWRVFGHLHEVSSRLPDTSRQAIEVTIHDLWAKLTAPLRDSAASGGGFVLPVMLLSIKRAVERVFVNQYKQVFTSTSLPGAEDEAVEQKLGQQLTVLINVICMLLLDPDCAYAHFGVLDATPKAIRLWKKIDVLLTSHGRGIASRMRVQAHRTSAPVQMLMRDRARSADPKTRSKLNKASSDPRLDGRTSAASSADAPAPSLDEQKRSVLFAAAHRQLARANPQSPAVLEFGDRRAPQRVRSADQRRRAPLPQAAAAASSARSAGSARSTPTSGQASSSGGASRCLGRA